MLENKYMLYAAEHVLSQCNGKTKIYMDVCTLNYMLNVYVKYYLWFIISMWYKCYLRMYVNSYLCFLISLWYD